VPPPGLPSAVTILFAPNDACPPNGLIVLPAGEISLAVWTQAFVLARDRTMDGLPSAPEISDAIDAVARAAGRRPNSQGFRESFKERRVIELRAMEAATEHLTSAGWEVEDVSATRSYDLHACRGADELHVEVKGTTGDGTAVLLTPNEVALARDKHPATALVVVSDVALTEADDGSPQAEGGSLAMIEPWDPDLAGDLYPTGFHCVLH
jgi:hypothetical protein